MERKKRRRSMRIRRLSVGPVVTDTSEDDSCKEQLLDALIIPLPSSIYGSEWRESPKSDAFIEKKKRRRSSRIHQLPIYRRETDTSSPELIRTKDVLSPEPHFKIDTPPFCMNYNNAQTPTHMEMKSTDENFNLHTPKMEEDKSPERDMTITLTPTCTSTNQEITSPEGAQLGSVNESFVTHRSSKHHNHLSARSEAPLQSPLLDSPLFRKVSSPFSEILPYSPSQPMKLLSSPVSQNFFESSFCHESPLKFDDQIASPYVDSEEDNQTSTNRKQCDIKQLKEQSSQMQVDSDIRTKTPTNALLSDDCVKTNLSGTVEIDLSRHDSTSYEIDKESVDTDIHNKDGSSSCEVKYVSSIMKDKCRDVTHPHTDVKIWTLGEIEMEFSQACTSSREEISGNTQEVIESMDALSPLDGCAGMDSETQDSNDFHMSGSLAESSGDVVSDINQSSCRRSTRMRRKSLEIFQATSHSENFKNKRKTKSMAFQEAIPLEDLYLNKKFVRPGDKSWETIFEKPVKGRAVGLKKLRRSILFENLTPTRLKKRQKKVKRLGLRKRQHLDDSFVQKKIAALDQELE